MLDYTCLYISPSFEKTVSLPLSIEVAKYFCIKFCPCCILTFSSGGRQNLSMTGKNSKIKVNVLFKSALFLVSQCITVHIKYIHPPLYDCNRNRPRAFFPSQNPFPLKSKFENWWLAILVFLCILWFQGSPKKSFVHRQPGEKLIMTHTHTHTHAPRCQLGDGRTDERPDGSSRSGSVSFFFMRRQRQPTNTRYKAANIENEYSATELAV